MPLVSTQRTSSSRISAAVPGIEPRPASRSSVSHSRMLVPALGDAVGDLHRREGVHVHRRHPRLDRAHQIGVAGHRQLGVDTALHAHLCRTRDVRLPGPVGDLVDRKRERVRVTLALRERAEPAAGVADVGEVDVAVDDERHVVADGVAPQRICQRANSIQCRTIRRSERQVLVVRAAGRIALRRTQRRQHVGVDPLRRPGREFGHLLADRLPVTERATEVAAGLGEPTLRHQSPSEGRCGPTTRMPRRAPATAGPPG